MIIHRSRIRINLIILFLSILPLSCLSTKKAVVPPLITSVIKGDLKEVQRLLTNGADPNTYDEPGVPALNWAAYYGHLDIVKTLVERKALVDLTDIHQWRTPLMNAASNGHLDVVAYLIDQGADLNLKALNGWTALDFAVKNQGPASPVATKIREFNEKKMSGRHKIAEEYSNYGLAAAKEDDFPRAIADFTNAIEMDPDFGEAYYNRAVVYFMAKDYNSAWTDAHKAEQSGYGVNPEFASKLKKVSGRDK